MRPLLATLLVFAVFAFTSLGIWQLQRRVWKLDLIAHTTQKLHTAPVPAPGPTTWPTLSKADVYTRLTATGHYLPASNTLVLAVTQYGRGSWVLSPFQTDSGFTVFINRGFITTDDQNRLNPAPTSPTTITGLLRLSEPHGAFLRTNIPHQHLWFSRDIPAIATTLNLTAAPYFIDADATTNAPHQPLGGLTVIAFPNNHLSYALTWFALAFMSLGGLYLLFKRKP